MSEALIFASTNPYYDDRLFIELQVQCMKTPNSKLGRTCCVQKLFLTFRTIFVHSMFSLCSAKRRVSDKDLPVRITSQFHEFLNLILAGFRHLKPLWSIASCHPLSRLCLPILLVMCAGKSFSTLGTTCWKQAASFHQELPFMLSMGKSSQIMAGTNNQLFITISKGTRLKLL